MAATIGSRTVSGFAGPGLGGPHVTLIGDVSAIGTASDAGEGRTDAAGATYSASIVRNRSAVAPAKCAIGNVRNSIDNGPWCAIGNTGRVTVGAACTASDSSSVNGAVARAASQGLGVTTSSSRSD